MGDIQSGLSKRQADLKAFGQAVRKCLAVGIYPAEIISNCPHKQQAAIDMDQLGLMNAQPNMQNRARVLGPVK